MLYIREKKNRSGTKSVVVFDKSNGFRELHTVGVSSDPQEIKELHLKAQEWIDKHVGQLGLDFDQKILNEEKVSSFLDCISNVLINGTQLLINKVFKAVGFDAVKDDILKSLVTARLAFPASKAATSEYLKSYFNEDISLRRIYLYLDRLHSREQKRVETLSIEHTKKILGGTLGLIFYDVTTLYFETDDEDLLRNRGWSKDGKHKNPQIILGLLVSMGGYPLAYCIHEGNYYEGQSMLPIVKSFVCEHDIKEPITVVADSGLMNESNMAELERLGYHFILGARIKNMGTALKEQILTCPRKKGASIEIPLNGDRRLLVTWSEARAKQDAYNRDKGVKRLQKAYAKGHLTKEQVNKRGYNKFLDIVGDTTVTINTDRIAEDTKWDGLKGFITNSNLPSDQVLKSYSDLWRIENAFRISKSKLEIRPIFHFTRERIEAHICICFIALKVYKELERRIKLAGIEMSVDKVLDAAKTVTTIQVKLENSSTVISRTMFLTPTHKLIEPLFDDSFWMD